MERECSVATDITDTSSLASSNDVHRHRQYLALLMKRGEDRWVQLWAVCFSILCDGGEFSLQVWKKEKNR